MTKKEIELLKNQSDEYYKKILTDRATYEREPTKENYANLAYSNGLYSAVDLILTKILADK